MLTNAKCSLKTKEFDIELDLMNYIPAIVKKPLSIMKTPNRTFPFYLLFADIDCEDPKMQKEL